MAKTLVGMKVLVTRPADQAVALCEKIEALGGEAIAFPVIEIAAVAGLDLSQLAVKSGDLMIFVSRNAVVHFAAMWQGTLPERVQMIAVGEATAAAMREVGLRVDMQPEREDSEGLLSMLSLQQLEGLLVWIVRGVGGRAHLAMGLREMGAEVAYIEVYERRLPVVTDAARRATREATCAVVTSVAGLDNLMALLPMQLAETQERPLLVISERIASHAVQCGFKQVIVTSGASDKAIVLALNEI